MCFVAGAEAELAGALKLGRSVGWFHILIRLKIGKAGEKKLCFPYCQGINASFFLNYPPCSAFLKKT